MPPHDAPAPSHDALAAEGARLAARGKAISDEMTALLADAFVALLADEAELARLHPASVRDVVDYLVRCGRLTRERPTENSILQDESRMTAE